MRTSTRRKVDAGILAVAAAGVGVAGFAGAVAGDGERVVSFWASATVSVSGEPARVTEVIDYDFGAAATDKHGIFRDVPAPELLDLTVDSDDAPDDFVVLDSSDDVEIRDDDQRIRVGDPDRTVTGRHRYRIGYGIDGLTRGSLVAWDAVGTRWRVPISHAEVHLLADQELDDLECVQGKEGSLAVCDVEQVEPGHLVVRVDDLDTGEGVTLTATLTGRAVSPPRARPPGVPDDDGNGLAKPMGAAALGALVGAAPASFWIRRRGRERVAGGGSADAAYASPGSERLIDADELEDMATTEFAPPEGLSPAQGGVLLAETVSNDHKVAWLMEQAIAGAVSIEGDKDKPTLRRLDFGDPAAAPILNTMFGGSDEITLGKYNKKFASAWTKVGTELERWSSSSGVFDPAGDRRRTWVRVLGVLVAIPAFGAVVVAGMLTARRSPATLALVAVPAAVAGAAAAAVVRAWELRVKTPHGSGLWLRLESFRRFLANSEAQHVEQAARLGVLREYTAWAVAVGEVDHWTRAMSKTTVVPPDVLHTAVLAGSLGHATSSSSTAPSSSSSGGGGGGVGGGGGGGGGGSW